MEDFKEYILKNHQVRKNRKQRKAFREWLQPYIQSMGYNCTFQEYKKNGRGVNVIVGDPEKAKIVLTAHYDTQAVMLLPVWMFVSNLFMFVVSQLILLIPYILMEVYLADIINYFINNARWAEEISDILILLYLWQGVFGIANKHTVNDNTSGVITLLTIMKQLRPELREDVAFVFFDQEELGLLGSRGFKREGRYDVDNMLLINFDCVSDGNNLCFIYKERFKESDSYDDLKIIIDEHQSDSKKVMLVSSSTYTYMSDQMRFKKGIGVAALKKVPVLGYYLDRIHTPLDTKYDQRNIDILSKVTIDFIEKL
ncbi:M28 family peptidase [Breznakia pachnodae]|uniref:Peptidase M28 domain-containing protein n=1 Tax=Breznakia pachnodae TaxID=265178 RepID=A0ABU0E384_9FIRM|nr:M28 family peptidase [Breznakia pachnodae]MDQ0361191.1 hypothetical protein [Breznakia pachnodae]